MSQPNLSQPSEFLTQVIELLVKRGTEKRILKARAAECLKMCLSHASWLAALHRSEDALRSVGEFFAGDEEMQAALAPAAAEAAAETAASPPPPPRESEEAAEAAAAEPLRKKLRDGRDALETYAWAFPDDPIGESFDHATAGFMRVLAPPPPTPAAPEKASPANLFARPPVPRAPAIREPLFSCGGRGDLQSRAKNRFSP